jgi:V/A-type H+-transporting ATPase subunit E
MATFMPVRCFSFKEGFNMEAELNLQHLLDRIKREGIEEAQKASQEILEQARSEAASVIEKAQKEAETIRSGAREEVRKGQEGFETAMAQAGRHLIHGLRTEIVQLCDHILERQVAASLTPEVMKDMILKVMDKWPILEDRPELEVLLKEEDRQGLEDMLYGSLQERLRKGIILKPAGRIKAGFRIGEKDGRMHYDLTHQGIAEVLGEYLNPRIAQFLQRTS